MILVKGWWSMWRVFCVLLLVLASAASTGLPSLAAANSLEEAEFAYAGGEYTQAARLFSPLAEQSTTATLPI